MCAVIYMTCTALSACRSATKNSTKIDVWQYMYLIRNMLNRYNLNAPIPSSVDNAYGNGLPSESAPEPQSKRGMKKDSGCMQHGHGMPNAEYWPSDEGIQAAIKEVTHSITLLQRFSCFVE